MHFNQHCPHKKGVRDRSGQQHRSHATGAFLPAVNDGVSRANLMKHKIMLFSPLLIAATLFAQSARSQECGPPTKNHGSASQAATACDLAATKYANPLTGETVSDKQMQEAFRALDRATAHRLENAHKQAASNMVNRVSLRDFGEKD